MKGFEKCCRSSAVNGTDGDMSWSDSGENGDVGGNGRKMKALIGTGRF